MRIRKMDFEIINLLIAVKIGLITFQFLKKFHIFSENIIFKLSMNYSTFIFKPL